MDELESSSIVDQTYVNLLAKLESYKPDSKEYEATLKAISILRESRKAEVEIESIYRNDLLNEEKIHNDKKTRIIDICVKAAIGVGSIIVGFVLGAGELDLEERGGNRSKAMQKAGQILRFKD